MPPLAPGKAHICLPCIVRDTTSTNARNLINLYEVFLGSRHFSVCTRDDLKQSARSKRQIQNGGSNLASATATDTHSNSSAQPELYQLTASHISKIGQLYKLRQKMHDGLSQISGAKKDSNDVPFEKALKTLTTKDDPSAIHFVQVLEQVYSGKPYVEAAEELELLRKHRKQSDTQVQDDATLDILRKLGIIPKENEKKKKKIVAAKSSEAPAENVTVKSEKTSTDQKLSKAESKKARRRAKVKPALTRPGSKRKSKIKIKKIFSERKPILKATTKRPFEMQIVAAPDDAKILDAALIQQRAIMTEEQPKVPRLSFDLSRVLFNPGVYQLQDPRSRVYNFDPYLENIMPVTEFNFDALNPYITSSEDEFLRDTSIQYGKRYIGSSSSMSGAMSQFHFLLSAWRPIDPSILSKRIQGLLTFTQITRAPASIFLRWRDGVYGIDADKEHDTPNILMMQGKSMEKLLTLEKDEFEKYRKAKEGETRPPVNADPEAYHYSTCGNFLLRSQLDAHDPRLPGTGMFDLKTRAVAGIRMNMSEHEVGMNYQIKDRFGLWESYDREYYDMIRAAFLKYSLQVRMGRMDGIFVAYHNIARIFGFQYISLEELDMALHGQADPTLGNREFKTTLKLMNEIFDQATKQFPEQSLRFTFETREPTKTEPCPYMRIFAQPMGDEEIDRIQKSGKAKVDEYEKSMANGINPARQQTKIAQTLEEKLREKQQSPSTLESNAADTSFLDKILGEQGKVEAEGKLSVPPELKEAPIACWTLRIYNEVNGGSVLRPVNLSLEDRWTVKYTLDFKVDDSTKSLYTATRNRRSAVLVWDLEAKQNNYFVQKIRDMSESGRVWRAEQDALDAEREQVVLYNHSL